MIACDISDIAILLNDVDENQERQGRASSRSGCSCCIPVNDRTCRSSARQQVNAELLIALQCIQDQQAWSNYNLALTPMGTILSSGSSALTRRGEGERTIGIELGVGSLTGV